MTCKLYNMTYELHYYKKKYPNTFTLHNEMMWYDVHVKCEKKTIQTQKIKSKQLAND